MLGVAIRLLPVLGSDQILLRQPTEDGYLLLTVARNMALGNGMSTMGGQTATNGVQPLITFLFSACYLLVGGDKVQGVRLAMLLSSVIAAAAGWFGYRFAALMLAPRRLGRSTALLAAALWFGCPLFVMHTANALETGLYALTVLAMLDFYGRMQPSLPLRQAATLGFLLGLCFWSRNDAVFLIATVCLVIVFGPGKLAPSARWGRAILVGGVATATALPWMASNLLRFGNVVPVSGQSEALGARFAANIAYLPAKLFEYLSTVVAIPDQLERTPPVIVASLAVVIGAVVVAARASRTANDVQRSLLLIVAGFTACLSVYYGLFFGAEYFMARYLFPVSFPLLLLTVATVGGQLMRIESTSRRRLAELAVAVVVAVPLTGLVYRRYQQRADHMHFQVVDWVLANTTTDTLVAAIQTGTLGYFHDRTINLDGKVNPYALKLRQRMEREQGRRDYVLEYVRDSAIEYLVDWAGIASWERNLRPDFRLLLEDDAKNLAVLKRVTPKRP